jgi:hypothetical protein
MSNFGLCFLHQLVAAIVKDGGMGRPRVLSNLVEMTLRLWPLEFQ